jgi:phosphoribosylformylglycinamidine cyclo-ligase
MTEGKGLTYSAAGVDTAAADALVSRIAAVARTASRPEVLSDVGPFAGLFKLGPYKDPVLVASTDSVGTKVKIASVLGRYASVGHDIVNHCVNDIGTTGAEPLFFLDYIGNFGLTDDQKVEMVGGVAEACRAVNCALIGGETADMPGTYEEGDYDLVGFIVGVVERDELIDGSQIEEGDVLLALPSNGLHTNGYSLVRTAFGVGMGRDPEEERAMLESSFTGLEGTLGDALLEPHRCYLEDVREARDAAQVRGIAHITGGGLEGNVPRIFPEGLGARIDRSSWHVPAIFRLIQEKGGVSEDEMFRAFNMGVGEVLVVSRDDVDGVRSKLPEAWAIGEVVVGGGVSWG